MNDTLILQLETARWALQQNLDGLSHDDSLHAAEAGGNCANWVVGHLVTAYDNLLEVLGEAPVADDGSMAPYQRGSGPLDPARARPLADLEADLEHAHARVVARLGSLTAEDFAAPSPVSPRNDPDETIGSLATLVAFHQAYHVGQTGLLRRAVGRAGAIA